MTFPILLAAILLTVPPTPAAATPVPEAPRPDRIPATADPSTEEGLRALLDLHEARYEEAGRHLAEALWKWMTEEGPHDGVMSARRDLLAVFEDPNLIAVLHDWNDRRMVTRDPTLSRRVNTWIRSGPLAAIELDPEIAAMADRLATSLSGHRYRLDGKETDADALRHLIATSDDAALRRRAWMALLEPGRRIEADLKALNRLRAVKARSVGAGTYHRLIYHAVEQNNNWLTLILHTIKRRTGPATRDLYARLRETMGTEDLAPWDLDRAMERLSVRRGARAVIDRHMPAGDAPAATERLLRAIGIDLGGLGILAAPGDHAPGGAAFAALIPGDFRRVLASRTDAGPSVSAFELILRDHGSALRTTYTTRTEPMLKGYDWVPGTSNPFWSEGCSEFLAAFVRDPAYLRDVVGMKPQEIAIFTEDLRDRSLLTLRRILLNMAWEQVLFINPDADLDARYRDQYRGAMGIDLGPGDPLPWTVEPRFVHRPVSWYADLAALGIAADAHEALRKSLGDRRLAEPKIGAWLTSRLAQGESVAMERRLADTFGAGFDLDRYLAWLVPDR